MSFGEPERIPLDKLFQEILLDLPEHPAATFYAAATPDKADIERRLFDDRADIQSVLLGNARMRQGKETVLAASDAGKALICTQRVAAGCNEVDNLFEILPERPR